MKIGVLDIQGSVQEHVDALEKLGVEVVKVKSAGDLAGLDGVIMPGGESTTIGGLMKKFGLWEAVIERVRGGMAVWGTCAGAILLVQMSLLDVEVERNAYGRQLDSFETEVEFEFSRGIREKFPGIFIRAPRFGRLGKGVGVVGRFGEELIALRQGGLLATSFHPELTDDLRVHEYFLKVCGGKV